MKKITLCALPAAERPISFKGYRFPPDVISYAVWLYYRFPLSPRMVEELLAARGIDASYESVWDWAASNRAEHSHQPARVREKIMRRFKSARH